MAAFALAVALVSALVASTPDGIELPRVFGDHMVLQRGKSIPVWGRAAPGEAIRVHFGGVAAAAMTDAEGNWRVDLRSLASIP